MDANLVLFVERAHKLETSSFWQWLSNRRGPSDIEKIAAGEWLAHDGLSQDSLEAFCLNLRFLIQPRDGFSVEQVAAIAASWPDEYALQGEKIQSAVAVLVHQLGKRCLVQLTDSKVTTNWDLFEVVFYGGIAHANPSKRDQFKSLTNAGLFTYFVFQAFSEVLFYYRNCIQALAFHVTQYLDSVSCRAHEGSQGTLLK
jgi:hypothetical protein